ncbi:hypothetical protein [Trinickia mobilis]|uniref:hypothetical protein n=1 Tax=Trinickia mobilis TaxID=2816356 RepID=UPI001A8BF94A|nr:hypothetical protein [Trinickia mobilis]
MAKSKHRQKKRRPLNRPAPDDGASFISVSSLFRGIARDDVVAALQTRGRASVDDFPKLLNEVREALDVGDPVGILATLAFYGTFGSAKKGLAWQAESGFSQSHVELAQAFLLQRRREDAEQQSPSPQSIQRQFELLTELTKSFNSMSFAQSTEGLSDEARAVLMLQQHLRVHTQAVRNWTYFQQAIDLCTRILARLEPEFASHIGIPASQLVALFDLFRRRTETRAREHLRRLSTTRKRKTLEALVDAYHHEFPELLNDPNRVASELKRLGYTKQQAALMMLAYADGLLPRIFEFSCSEVSDELGLEIGSVHAVLRNLGHRFGDLASANSGHVLLDNPVWCKPLVQVDDERFYCFMSPLFTGYFFAIIRHLLGGHEKILRKFEREKAGFLEDEIERLFRSAFSDAEVARSYKWSEGENTYENDLIVRVDSHLFLIEAKSGSVTPQALRGAPDRARRHVRDLMLAPSEQSLRLQIRLQTALDDVSKRDMLVPEFPISLDGVSTLLRLSVTLEDFAVLQSNLSLVKRAGWIPEDHPVAPCMLVSDLAAVFDILDTEAQKIHYLKRRLELHQTLLHFGDELDLLGLYLATGFNIGDAEINGTALSISGLSSNIDLYYSQLEAGLAPQKPKAKVTRFWFDIIAAFERRRFPGWSEAACIVLNFGHEEQEQMERMLRRIYKNVKKRGYKESDATSVVAVPQVFRKSALAMYAYRKIDAPERHEAMENLALRTFDESHVELCLVFGVNVDQGHYPYSAITLFRRPTEAESSFVGAN